VVEDTKGKAMEAAGAIADDDRLKKRGRAQQDKVAPQRLSPCGAVRMVTSLLREPVPVGRLKKPPCSSCVDVPNSSCNGPLDARLSTNVQAPVPDGAVLGGTP
jgi:hypothetical protein